MNLQSHPILACGSVLLAFASSLVAQLGVDGIGENGASHERSVISRAFGMAEVDGRVCAGGPGYKAQFDASGMTYTPALGESAPHNYPWRFSLSSIRRGEHVLFDTRTMGASEPVLTKRSASYDRAGVVERYEARVDGVKQDFVFMSRPAGHGDLVVEGVITTDLLPRRTRSNSSSLTFSAEGVGGVTVGGVLGVDDNGWQVPGETSFEDGAIRFVLPETFVAAATYPMVLDPLVGTFFTVAGSQASDPDVAWDETNDAYLVVWEQVFSSLDIDVRGQQFGVSGNLIGNLINLTFESGNEINPAVANSDLANRFFVVYQDGASPFGPWNIRGRSVTAGANPALTSILDISTPGGTNEVTPDIGGDSTLVDDKVVVVWADDNGNIVGTSVDVSSSTVAFPTVLRFGQSTNPAISKSGGADGRYVVVWERDYTIDLDVESAMVDRNMTVLDALASVGSFAGIDELRPDVDGDGTEFVVAYQRQETLDPNRYDIYCRRVVWDGSNLSGIGATRNVSSNAGVDDTEPAVGFLGLKYVVAWVHGTAFFTDIQMVEYDAENCTACGVPETSLGGANPLDFGPEVATRHQGRASNDPVAADQGLIVWTDMTVGPGTIDSGVVGRRYEAFTGGAVTNLGGACGNGGVNGFNGPVALGNSQLELTLSGAASTNVHIGIQFSNAVIPCGPCTINADGGYYPVTASPSGSASFAVAIPCDLSIQGVSLYTQWATVLSGQNPCGLIPAVAELSFSNRLRAVIAP